MSKGNKKALKRRLAGAYVSSVISITLVLLLVGAATFILVNAGRVTEFFKENLQITVLMNTEVSDAAAEEYRAGINSLPCIHGTALVTREQGTEELKAMLGEDFLDVFETSPVPSSIEVTLEAEYVSPDSLGAVTSLLKESPLVDEVVCRQGLVEALNANLARISLVLAVLIALMMFISFVLIGNTVRINIFSKRFTIHTMKLVGATRSFIIKPFMKGAVLQGLVSAVLASVIIECGLMYVRHSLPPFVLSGGFRTTAPVFAVVFVTAVIISVLSSFLAVNKLISMEKDELYY